MSVPARHSTRRRSARRFVAQDARNAPDRARLPGSGSGPFVHDACSDPRTWAPALAGNEHECTAAGHVEPARRTRRAPRRAPGTHGRPHARTVYSARGRLARDRGYTTRRYIDRGSGRGAPCSARPWHPADHDIDRTPHPRSARSARRTSRQPDHNDPPYRYRRLHRRERRNPPRSHQPPGSRQTPIPHGPRIPRHTRPRRSSVFVVPCASTGATATRAISITADETIIPYRSTLNLLRWAGPTTEYPAPPGPSLPSDVPSPGWAGQYRNGTFSHLGIFSHLSRVVSPVIPSAGGAYRDQRGPATSRRHGDAPTRAPATGKRRSLRAARIQAPAALRRDRRDRVRPPPTADRRTVASPSSPDSIAKR